MNNKMNSSILYVAVSSQTGGVPKHIMYALKYAKQHGYKIAVAVPDDGEYYPWFQELSVDMLNISLKPYSFLSLWKIRNYIKKNKIGIIHSHGKGAGMYTRPMKLLCSGVKVVHTFHGIYLEQYGRKIQRFYCGIEHLLKRWTDWFICVSESERTEAMRLGFVCEERTSVIFNAVDTELFVKMKVNRNNYLEEFGFPDDVYIIGCVARLEQMKGHRYLISAFKNLIVNNPKCRLLLIGEGPERRKIEGQIRNFGLEEYVILTGIRHDVPQLLKIFDIFVSASLKEGMPYTLVEALSAGVMVVATDVIGNRDIIHNGKNGLLVQSQDIQSMENALKKIIEEPELCIQLRTAGQEDARMRFDLEHSQEQLFGIYRKLVGES